MPRKARTLPGFVRRHRKAIDAHIRAVCRRPTLALNQRARIEWVLNDERLYRWALAEGVEV